MFHSGGQTGMARLIFPVSKFFFSNASKRERIRVGCSYKGYLVRLSLAEELPTNISFPYPREHLVTATHGSVPTCRHSMSSAAVTLVSGLHSKSSQFEPPTVWDISWWTQALFLWSVSRRTPKQPHRNPCNIYTFRRLTWNVFKDLARTT
jgi:hypothetical protein